MTVRNIGEEGSVESNLDAPLLVVQELDGTVIVQPFNDFGSPEDAALLLYDATLALVGELSPAAVAAFKLAVFLKLDGL